MPDFPTLLRFGFFIEAGLDWRQQRYTRIREAISIARIHLDGMVHEHFIHKTKRTLAVQWSYRLNNNMCHEKKARYQSRGCKKVKI